MTRCPRCGAVDMWEVTAERPVSAPPRSRFSYLLSCPRCYASIPLGSRRHAALVVAESQQINQDLERRLLSALGGEVSS